MPNLGKLLSEIWKFEKIPRQLRDLIEYKEERSDLKQFYEKLKKNPQINNLITKIANKQRFNIQDFFIINSLCKNEFSDISITEINTYLPDIAKLFIQIMKFEVNLPYEKLNSYDTNYYNYYQSVLTNIYSDQYYIVFDIMCNSYLIDNEQHNTNTHAVSYSNGIIKKIIEQSIYLIKSTDVKDTCMISPKSQKTSSIVKLTPEEEAKKKEEMAKKRKEMALARKIAEEERKKAEEERKKAQTFSRSARASARNSARN